LARELPRTAASSGSSAARSTYVTQLHCAVSRHSCVCSSCISIFLATTHGATCFGHLWFATCTTIALCVSISSGNQEVSLYRLTYQCGRSCSWQFIFRLQAAIVALSSTDPSSFRMRVILDAAIAMEKQRFEVSHAQPWPMAPPGRGPNRTVSILNCHNACKVCVLQPFILGYKLV
jgi:hypothetical protein